MPASDVVRSGQAYWDLAADTYDRDFAGTLIGQTRRAAVWRDLERVFHPGQRVLELNCGTGLDAVHLAERGVQILACDIAPRMIEIAMHRANRANLCNRIDFRVLANEDLARLDAEGPFDGAFSNFSGLNCVEDLFSFARALARLLKPGTPVLISMMGRFVPWELMWFVAHADVRKAIRRFRRTSTCHISPFTPKIQHLTITEVTRLFAPEFKLRAWKGIGIAVPPSYMEHWARRFPRTTKALARADRLLENLPIFRSMADCILLEFERGNTEVPENEIG